MEQFTLTGANGWQTLSSLLLADATFKGRFLWSSMRITNNSSNDMIIKNKPGATAPSTGSGENLGPGVSSNNDLYKGQIDGRAIWIKCSAGSTSFDVVISPTSGGS